MVIKQGILKLSPESKKGSTSNPNGKSKTEVLPILEILTSWKTKEVYIVTWEKSPVCEDGLLRMKIKNEMKKTSHVTT